MCRVLAVSLATIFFTNQVLFAHKPEMAFWAERQKSQQQLASLPSGFLPSPAFPSKMNTAVLPTVRASLSQVDGQSHIPQFESGVPAQFLNIRKISPPAVSSEYVKKPSVKKVILIEDVHLNTEAQTNIANALQLLIDQKKVDVVAVEGAFGDFDFGPFRSFPDKQITRDVAEAYLKDNRVGAPSYVGITSPTELPPFVGIDDKSHYDANVQAIRDAAEHRKEVEGELAKKRDTLEGKKQDLYNPVLKKVDHALTAYQKGTLSLGNFLQILLASSAEELDYDLVVAQFLEAFEIEKNMDLSRVERERRQILNILAQKLSEEDLSILMQQVAMYQSGSLTFGRFYSNLKDLLEQKGISLKGMPAFESYLHYVLLTEGINADELLKSVKNVTDQVFEKLAQSDAERGLIRQSRELYLNERLVALGLTPGEWEEYKSMLRFYDATLLRKNSISWHRSIVASYERFYEEAHHRSQKMVENLIKVTSEEDTAVLITGGFHSPSIAQELRRRDISYVVASPKISKIESTSGTEYLSIFTQKKSPLEKLFEGKSLFVYPSQLNIGAQGGDEFQAHQSVLQQYKRGIPGVLKTKGGEVPRYFAVGKSPAPLGYVSTGKSLTIGDVILQPVLPLTSVAYRMTRQLGQLSLRLLGSINNGMGFVSKDNRWMLPIVGFIAAALLISPRETLLSLSFLAMILQPWEHDNTWLGRHYSPLLNENILEVSMEMAPTPEQFKQLWQEAPFLAKKDGLTPDEIMRRVAMAQSVGGIGPLLSDRFVALANLGAKPVVFAPLYKGVYVQRFSESQFDLKWVESGKYLKKILGRPVHQISMFTLDGRNIKVNIYQHTYKKGRVYFMDVHDPEIFKVAYPGKIAGEGEFNRDDHDRWILGRGSLKATKELDIKPNFIIQSEVEAAFANPHLIKDEFQDDPFFRNAKVILNDHTPREYAHPNFTQAEADRIKIDPIFYDKLHVWLRDGKPISPQKRFSQHSVLDLTKVLLLASKWMFGVSKAHAMVMKKMGILEDLGRFITSITNGVLNERWQADEFKNAGDYSDDELMAIKQKKKEKLVDFLGSRLGRNSQWKEKVKNMAIVRFQRRLTSYKRVDLIFKILTDLNLLNQFLNTKTVLLLGGRVHQLDNWAKPKVQLLAHISYCPLEEFLNPSKIAEFSNDSREIGNTIRMLRPLYDNPHMLENLRERVIFFDNYNIWEAPILVQGSDASIMLSDLNQEASATGFQKDQMNGAIVIAVPGEGAISESVRFYEDQGEVNQSRWGGKSSSLRKQLGNGFKVPFSGPDADHAHLDPRQLSPNDLKGPTADGLLKALQKVGWVVQGKNAEGEVDEYFHAAMMRNAIALSSQVSVHRTARDMIRFLVKVFDRQRNDQMMFEKGFARGRRLAQRYPQVTARLNKVQDLVPFEWKYKYRGMVDHTIYVHPQDDGNGAIRNFVAGFQRVTRMGIIGRWSLLYHAADDINNHFFMYLENIFKKFNEFRSNEELRGLYEDIVLETETKMMNLHLQKATIEELRESLAVAKSDEEVKNLSEQINLEEEDLEVRQDHLIAHIYKLVGMLEGLIGISQDKVDELVTEKKKRSKQTPGAIALKLWKKLGWGADLPRVGIWESHGMNVAFVGVTALLMRLGVFPTSQEFVATIGLGLWGVIRAFSWVIFNCGGIIAIILVFVFIGHKHHGILQPDGSVYKKPTFSDTFRATGVASRSFQGWYLTGFGMLLMSNFLFGQPEMIDSVLFGLGLILVFTGFKMGAESHARKNKKGQMEFLDKEIQEIKFTGDLKPKEREVLVEEAKKIMSYLSLSRYNIKETDIIDVVRKPHASTQVPYDAFFILGSPDSTVPITAAQDYERLIRQRFPKRAFFDPFPIPVYFSGGKGHRPNMLSILEQQDFPYHLWDSEAHQYRKWFIDRIREIRREEFQRWLVKDNEFWQDIPLGRSAIRFVVEVYSKFLWLATAPRWNLFIESASTNTGDNVTITHESWRSKGFNPNNILVYTSGVFQLRLLLTLLEQSPLIERKNGGNEFHSPTGAQYHIRLADDIDVENLDDLDLLVLGFLEWDQIKKLKEYSYPTVERNAYISKPRNLGTYLEKADKIHPIIKIHVDSVSTVSESIKNAVQEDSGDLKHLGGSDEVEMDEDDDEENGQKAENGDVTGAMGIWKKLGLAHTPTIGGLEGLIGILISVALIYLFGVMPQAPPQTFFDCICLLGISLLIIPTTIFSLGFLGHKLTGMILSDGTLITNPTYREAWHATVLASSSAVGFPLVMGGFIYQHWLLTPVLFGMGVALGTLVHYWINWRIGWQIDNIPTLIEKNPKRGFNLMAKLMAHQSLTFKQLGKLFEVYLSQLNIMGRVSYKRAAERALIKALTEPHVISPVKGFQFLVDMIVEMDIKFLGVEGWNFMKWDALNDMAVAIQKNEELENFVRNELPRQSEDHHNIAGEILKRAGLVREEPRRVDNAWNIRTEQLKRFLGNHGDEEAISDEIYGEMIEAFPTIETFGIQAYGNRRDVMLKKEIKENPLGVAQMVYLTVAAEMQEVRQIRGVFQVLMEASFNVMSEKITWVVKGQTINEVLVEIRVFQEHPGFAKLKRFGEVDIIALQLEEEDREALTQQLGNWPGAIYMKSDLTDLKATLKILQESSRQREDIQKYKVFLPRGVALPMPLLTALSRMQESKEFQKRLKIYFIDSLIASAPVLELMTNILHMQRFTDLVVGSQA
jgi:hypothetical protein